MPLCVTAPHRRSHPIRSDPSAHTPRIGELPPSEHLVIMPLMGAGSSDESSSQQAPGTSSSYIPADHDIDFLQRDELRPLRLGLELLKPELIQTEQGIRLDSITGLPRRSNLSATCRRSRTPPGPLAIL
jgi:hypothetical protein